MNALRRRFSFVAAFLVTVLLATGVTAASAADALAPRQVTKRGNVEVPAGMHLVTDRTGTRWLLADDQDTPPERELMPKYFVATVVPQVRGTLGGDQVLNSPLSSVDTVVSRDRNDANNIMKLLPASFAETMVLEKQANLHAQTSADLLALGEFAPNRFTTFKVPFIPIPKSAMEFAQVSDYASPATKNLVEFTDNGIEYVRFFILPNYVNSYAELIARYGIVYKYVQ